MDPSLWQLCSHPQGHSLGQTLGEWIREVGGGGSRLSWSFRPDYVGGNLRKRQAQGPHVQMTKLRLKEAWDLCKVTQRVVAGLACDMVSLVLLPHSTSPLGLLKAEL